MYFKKLFFLLLFLLSISVFPQTVIKDSANTFHLSDVVISATKTKRPQIEVAGAISVIESKQIEEKNKLTVYDLLKDEYGLSLSQSGGPGKLAYVYLRGANSGHTLVLIDGVEMNMPNDPDNTFDFSGLPADNIEKIEILRGPQSTLYGSDALAGVINIITKKGNGKPKISLSAEGGSFHTYKGLGSLSGSLGKMNYSISLSRMKTDGFSSASAKYGNTEKDGAENWNAVSSLGYSFNANLNINLFLRYNKGKSDFDQIGGKFGDDPTYIYKFEEGAYRLEGNFSSFGKKLNQKLGISFLRNIRKYSFDSTLYNPASSRSIYDGRKIKIDLQNDFQLTENDLVTLGIETEEEKANSEYYYASYPQYNLISVFPDNSSRTTGIYLQNQYNYKNNFFISGGIRFDHQSRFGSVTTYKIAPAYLIWQTGTKLRATFGTGFKTPSLFYLFDPAYGNQNLKPEKSSGWDAGIEQFLFNSQLIFGCNYFSSSFSNLFSFDPATYKTINLNSAKTSGVEVYSTLKINNNFSIKTNYTLTYAKDKSISSPDYDKELLRRPKNKIALNINYTFLDKGNANLEAIYAGKRFDKDFTNGKRVVLSAYSVINFALSFKLSEKLKLFGRIENLFNNYYEEVLGYATPGQSFYAGIKAEI